MIRRPFVALFLLLPAACAVPQARDPLPEATVTAALNAHAGTGPGAAEAEAARENLRRIFAACSTGQPDPALKSACAPPILP